LQTTDDVQQKDEADLVPMLKRMATIKDLNTLKLQADEFLTKCRFAGDKIVAHKRKLQELSNATEIQQLCWNTLLSGEGQKVLRV
jgi:hypothetical protein